MQTVRMLTLAGIASCLVSATLRPPPQGLSWSDARQRLKKSHTVAREGVWWGLTRDRSPAPTRTPLEAAAAAREFQELALRFSEYALPVGDAYRLRAGLEERAGRREVADRWAERCQQRALRGLWLGVHDVFSRTRYLARAGRHREALAAVRDQVLPVLRVELGEDHAVTQGGLRLQEHLSSLVEAARKEEQR